MQEGVDGSLEEAEARCLFRICQSGVDGDIGVQLFFVLAPSHVEERVHVVHPQPLSHRLGHLIFLLSLLCLEQCILCSGELAKPDGNVDLLCDRSVSVERGEISLDQLVVPPRKGAATRRRDWSGCVDGGRRRGPNGEGAEQRC